MKKGANTKRCEMTKILTQKGANAKKTNTKRTTKMCKHHKEIRKNEKKKDRKPKGANGKETNTKKYEEGANDI